MGRSDKRRPDQRNVDSRPEHGVVTVTLNPALDVSMSIDLLVPDRKLRAHDVRREAGGGGVNVSRVLRRLGVPNTSFVVTGGAIGDELLTLMRHEGLDVIGFTIDGTTRESVAITETNTARQYRVSVPGPTVDRPDELQRILREISAAASIVVLSGSVPHGLPSDFYARLLEDLDPDVTAIVDTAGAALAAVVGSATRGADVVKPSQRELAELVGWEPETPHQIEQAVQEVLGLGGTRAVIASRGPSGALLATRDGELRWYRPPPVRPVSTVGAGDSTVAGIAAALAHGDDLVSAVRLGVAAGTATVLTPGTELCDPDVVERFVEQVTDTAAQ
ncbi:MAG: 1-phosphofructokinase family hexose kinase [Ilumatobacteraceae bacterium]